MEANVAEDIFPVDIDDFDDGHKPGNSATSTRIASYPNKSSADFFAIFDGLMEDRWCAQAFDYAIQKSKPWGAYVTMIDALDNQLSADQLWDNGKFEHAISLVAVRQLLLQRGRGFLGDDISRLHGTAVWCLSSSATNEVKYHVDYAELHRYETNVIYPPVYAGTCHISPVHGPEDMVGGDFMANTEGIGHYQRFGYKGRKASKEEFEADLQQSPNWIRVPYKYNRGILHDGNYSHLSTEVKFIREGLRRVILGFNVFTHHVSECNLRAPEHSEAFNRTIRLYQRLAQAGIPITGREEGEVSPGDDESQTNGDLTNAEQAIIKQKKAGGLNVKDIMKNPALAKLLVKAAKKVKELRETDR